MLQIVKDFLVTYDMNYSNSIFSSESNLREDVKRDDLLKKLNL